MLTRKFAKKTRWKSVSVAGKGGCVMIFMWLFLSAPAGAQVLIKQFSPQAVSSVSLLTTENRPFHLSLSGRRSGLYAIVFLSPECPLCQNYTFTLNKLMQEVQDDNVQIIGIIPGKSYSAADVKTFAEKYKLRFPLYIDAAKKLSRLLQAKITPEVILLNGTGRLVYRGLIDNWAVSLGQQRTVVTRHYLRDAIAAGLGHAPLQTMQTKPVGCLINDF